MRIDTHLSANSVRDGHAHLVDVDRQALAVPMELTGPDEKVSGCAGAVAGASLGHAPSPGRPTVQRHIERAVVHRIGRATAAGPGVVGREDTAHEGDQRQTMGAIVAQGIDIPPEVATGCKRLVKAGLAIRAAAASRPDSAAIGTPGPGCTLPPAR
jgi:hypothetical protein